MAQWSAALDALSQLVRHGAFAAPATDPTACQSNVLRPAMAFFVASGARNPNGPPCSNAAKQALSKQIIAVARALAALDASLQPCVAVGDRAAATQLAAALRVIRGGIACVAELQLRPAVSEALAQAAAALLLSGSGLRQLQVLARSPAALRPSSAGGPSTALTAAHDQLEAVNALEMLLAGPQLAAVRAATFAPARVLSWLTACTDLLLAAVDDPEGSVTASALRMFSIVTSAYVQHLPTARPIATNATLAPRLAALLLRCLRMAAHVPSALEHDSPPDAGVPGQQGLAAVDDVCIRAVVLALGSDALAPGLRAHLSGRVEEALTALEAACTLLPRVLPPGAGLGPDHLHARVPGLALKLAGSLAASVPTDGWRFTRLPEREPLPPPPQLQRMGQLLMAAAPAVAATYKAVAAAAAEAQDGGVRKRLLQGAATSTHNLLLMTTCKTSASSLLELQQVCAAADAVLRLLPTALQLAQQQAQQAAGTEPGPDSLPAAWCRVPVACMWAWAHATRLAFLSAEDYAGRHGWAAAVDPQEGPALARQLWALHQRSCRLVHLVPGAPVPLLQQGQGPAPSMLLQRLCFSHNSAYLVLHRYLSQQQMGAGSAGDDVRKLLQPMGAAHLEALAALEPLLRPADLLPSNLPAGGGMLAAMACAPGMALSSPACARMLRHEVDGVCQAGPNRLAAIAILLLRLDSTHSSPLLLADLFASGAAGDLLRACQQDAASLAPGLHDTLRRTLQHVADLLYLPLALAAVHIAPTAPADQAPLLHSLAAALRQAAGPVREGRLPPPAQLQLLVDALPVAQQLAGELHSLFQAPALQQELELEAALVSARRACAYLRCSNVGAEGGMAVGEQAGSAKCSGCRVAWYCLAECSKAAWRCSPGSHKRTCRALAAWRQQQRQAGAAGTP